MNIAHLDSTLDVDKVLDVTVIEPRLKHPTIFKYFDQLVAGDYFILHNDHDPKPVYYQLLGERGPIFTFDYLSKGPDDWFIRIQKNAPENDQIGTQKETTLTAKELKKAAFFAAKGEQYSCEAGNNDKKEGDQEKTGAAANLNYPQGTTSQPAPVKEDIILQYDSWHTGFLCDFIEQTDHSYFRELAPQLDELGEQIRLKHQQSHPALATLKMYQDQLLATLLFHLTQEKSAIFDGVKQIEQSIQKNEEPEALALKQLYTGVTLKKQANETLAGLLNQIRRHANQYQAPADACDAYQYYFKRLSQFDLRVSRYLHLENTVLIPKVRKWL